MTCAQSTIVRRAVTSTCRRLLQGLVPEEEVGHAAPFVLVVLPTRRPGTSWERWAGVGEQLDGTLIQADLGPLRIIGLGIDIQHILHVPDKCRTLPRWNAPLLLQMRLQLVFLSVRR